MGLQKKCDITGKDMGEKDIDFGGQKHALPFAPGSPIKLIVEPRWTGQFGGGFHISREGMEKLLVDAAEALPGTAKTTATTPAATTDSTPENPPADPEVKDDKTTSGGKKLTR